MKHTFVIVLLTVFSLSTVFAQNISDDERKRSDGNDAVELEPVTVTAQKREQNILDVPATISTIGAQTLDNTGIRSLELLSDFVPGLSIRIQTPHRPSLVIRGLTSDEVAPTAQPRISVSFNGVTISRASMAVTEIYDMERIEVLKGPQGTLFGRGSQIGAINFISKKPEYNFGGYLSAGFGNFAMKELEGALNIPIIGNKLAARVSGIYSYMDGYVNNTSGGKLNGKNTLGGRFSATFAPTDKLNFDLTVNYQNDNNPGTAFMSKRYPNAKGSTNIFDYEASFDAGKEWYNKREVLGTILEARYRIDENSSITSTTSYHTNSVDHRWDGDGTLAPAIDMTETDRVKQFTQELRYNFSIADRLTGFFGLSYWFEDVSQKYYLTPNEQYMYYPIADMMNGYGYPFPTLPLVSPDGTLAPPMLAIPGAFLSSPYDIPLPTNHEEANAGGALNSAGDMFFDATYGISSKLSLTAGVRASTESFITSSEAYMVGSTPSSLGMLSENPSLNLLFPPKQYSEIQRTFLSLTYRLGLKYNLNDRSNLWAGYARGRRPNVLQFNSSTGENEVINSEKVHSFDAGFKWSDKRYRFDLGLFYQLYSDFQTNRFVNGNYLTEDIGKATSYGLETSAQVALCSAVDVFGNYAWIHARFDDIDSKGNSQGEYAGKTFRLTPEHAFMLGLNAKLYVSDDFRLIFTPTYSWRTHIWFDDLNDLQPADPTLDRLEQNAYGLLNANLALKHTKSGLTLSVFGANLTDTKYIIGAGNTGMMFGLPTYVPGAPRMFGAKLRFNF